MPKKFDKDKWEVEDDEDLPDKDDIDDSEVDEDDSDRKWEEE